MYIYIYLCVCVSLYLSLSLSLSRAKILWGKPQSKNAWLTKMLHGSTMYQHDGIAAQGRICLDMLVSQMSIL